MNLTSVRERLERRSRSRRNTNRFRHIASVAVRYGLADRLRKIPGRLNPQFGLFELIQPYAEAAARRRFAPKRAWLQVQRGARAWARLLRTVPSDLNDMLASMRSGTLSVHLDHRRLDPVVNRLVLGLLTSSLLLGSSLLWSLQAEPVVGGVSLFGAIGYAAACVMGLSLFRDIGNSDIPQKTSDRGKHLRSPRAICLYFVAPAGSDAAPTPPNLLNINHIAMPPEWS
jgi:ubiquinone biosynthesis protein